MDTERPLAGLHCGEVMADLTEHLDARLGAERSARIGEHLDGCERCRNVREEIAAAVCALRELPEEPLPPEIAEHLFAGLWAEDGNV